MAGDTVLVFNATNPHFYLIHVTAIVSLSISIIVSFSTLVFLCLSNPVKNIFRRHVGERLVVYLAVTDLLYSCEHIVDHLYAVVTADLPPDTLCVVSAFFLQEFFTAQSLIVLTTAFTTYMLIRHGCKIGFGRNDIGLLSFSFGLPLVMGIVMVSFDLFGPSGYWCLADLSTPVGFVVNNVISGTAILVTLLNVIFYLLTWYQVHTTTSMLKQHGMQNASRQKERHAALLMMAVVAAYLVQWWPAIVFATWNMFETPHIALVESLVIFCNLGGVFNFLAYTFIRRMHHRSTTSTSAVTSRSTGVSHVHEQSHHTDAEKRNTLPIDPNKTECHL